MTSSSSSPLGERHCCPQAPWLWDYAISGHWVAPLEPSSPPASLPPLSVNCHVHRPPLHHCRGWRRWRRWGQTGAPGRSRHARVSPRYTSPRPPGPASPRLPAVPGAARRPPRDPLSPPPLPPSPSAGPLGSATNASALSAPRPVPHLRRGDSDGDGNPCRQQEEDVELHP